MDLKSSGNLELLVAMKGLGALVSLHLLTLAVHIHFQELLGEGVGRFAYHRCCHAYELDLQRV